MTPEPFLAIGIHYADFHQLSDEDVVRILDAADTGMGRAELARPHPRAYETAPPDSWSPASPTFVARRPPK